MPLPVWVTNCQKPLCCHSQGGVDRTLLCYLCEGVDVGDCEAKDVMEVRGNMGEDVEVAEEREGEEDEDEVPDYQG